MGPLDALLELGVDVQSHLRVDMSDLAHDPLDVEVVREQGDRDVGAAEAVRRGVRQRGKASLLQPLARERGGLPDDSRDALPREPASPHVRDQVRIGTDWRADSVEPVEVLDDRLDEVGAHPDLADPGVRLRVPDAESSSRGRAAGPRRCAGRRARSHERLSGRGPRRRRAGRHTPSAPRARGA